MKILIFLLILFPALSLGATQISVGTGFIHQNYNEPKLDQETGFIPLLQVGINHTFNQLKLSATFSQSEGVIKYQGHLLFSPSIPITQEDYSTINELSVRGEYASGWISPFIEGTIYHWDRQLSKYQDERYSTLFVGGGVILRYKWFSIAPSAGATIHSHIQTLGMDFPLGTKPYERIVGSVIYPLDSHWSVSTQVSYQHFGFGRSKPKYFSYEPTSFTSQARFGLKLNYSF